MLWVVALGWGFALLVAAVVLGFCAYEISWKAARLTRDLDGLRTLRSELATMQTDLAALQPRLAGRTNH